MDRETFDNIHTLYNIIYKATKHNQIIWNRVNGIYIAELSKDDIEHLRLECYDNCLHIIYGNHSWFASDDILYKVITTQWYSFHKDKLPSSTFSSITSILSSNNISID